MSGANLALVLARTIAYAVILHTLAGAAEQAQYGYDDNGNLVLVEPWDPAAGDGEGAERYEALYRDRGWLRAGSGEERSS